MFLWELNDDKKSWLFILLSLMSVSFACVMLAGSSDNCSIIKNTAWGKEGYGIGNEASAGDYYYGTRFYCTPAGVAKSYADLNDTCDSAGVAAIVLTSLLLVSAVLTLGVGIMRTMLRDHRWTAFGVGASLAGVFFSVLAMSAFNEKCLERDEGYRNDDDYIDPSVSVTLGTFVILTLTMNAALQYQVGNGRLGEPINEL